MQFNIETGRGKYECIYVGGTIGLNEKGHEGYWQVNASFTKICSAIFTMPSDWSRTRVFQFIDSIDKSFE